MAKEIDKIIQSKTAPKSNNVLWDDGENLKIDEKYLPNTVLKTTPQKLSDVDKNQARLNIGISTPDWNAQAGEAGYIDNKPFGEGFKAVNWFYDDDASWCITPMISNKVKYEGVIYEIPDNTDDGPVSLGDGSIALAKYPYYDDNLMHVVCYGIEDSTDERLQNILFEVNVKLDEKHIPDTIARTEYVTALEARIAALEAKLNS